MGHKGRFIVGSSLVACAAFAACSAGPASSPRRTCGFPPPVPIEPLYLAYPIPSATGVPLFIGSVIVQGYVAGFYGPGTLSVTTSAGTAIVKNVSPTAAPSPLPTPLATPVQNLPYEAVPVPALMPATQYVVTAAVPDWGETPPLCRTIDTMTLGTFTTGS
jgi:hypothetical protein